MVQMTEVAKIRARWKRDGEPYCEHERTDKEYSLGADTGDWACLDCGLTWPRNQETPEPSGAAPGTSGLAQGPV